MDAQDVELFHRLYDAVLQEKGNCRVLVQTYFGDVRDVYQDLTAMDFDGIGLDFLEGKETGAPDRSSTAFRLTKSCLRDLSMERIFGRIITRKHCRR